MMKIAKILQIFFAMSEIIFIVFLSFLMYLQMSVSTSQILYIPKGSVGEIISYLKDRNSNVSVIDKYVLIALGHPQSGWVDIKSKNLSKMDFLYKLTTAKAALTDITLIPGETTAVFLKDIAAKLNLNEAVLGEHYQKLAVSDDGFFVPETYKIPIGISEAELIQYLANLAKKSHEELAVKTLGAYDEKKWREFLIIASVIQKEAADESEMPLVASVIYNRLNKGMRLQMDGTLNYGLYSHDVITPERIRQDTSKFNTYLHDGLPPTPICAVSPSAIKAAINPANTDFLYFVRDKKTKKHRFSKTLAEHNQNIDRQR